MTLKKKNSQDPSVHQKMSTGALKSRAETEAKCGPADPVETLSGPMMSARQLHRLDLCPARFGIQRETVHFRESWAVNDVIDPFLPFLRPKSGPLRKLPVS
jgi:hypothetical protein